jgi:FkbM family methyltransferase
LVELLAALRGGITLAAVKQVVPGSGPAEIRSAEIAPYAAQSDGLTLYRRVGRCCLRLIRPLVMPFVVRLQRRISIGVDESRSAQLLRELLARQDEVNARLERMATDVQSLQSMPPSDLSMVEMVLEAGGWLKPGTTTVVQALLEPNDFAVDIGANVGALTLAMARSVAPAGRVLAIEPTPRTVALLKQASAMAGLDRIIRVEECAAGKADGKALLSVGDTSRRNSLVPLERAGGIEVQVRSLDEILPGGELPALVKIDVEGFELEVWRGMERILREAPNLAVIVDLDPDRVRRSDMTIAAWLAILTAPGFTPWEINETSGTIRPLRPSGLQDAGTMNLLLLQHPPSRWPRLRVAV